MRIYFSNLSVFNKNAKRIQYIIENLQFSDSKFDQAKDRIKLTSIKNHLAVAYGYNGLTEIAESLSDEIPQLKDLKNEQLIEVESRISEVFSKYFQSLGVSKRSSLCVSSGIDFYLRNQAQDTVNRLKYDSNYASYTDLAKRYGLTVPALKKHLVSKNVLSDHIPTTQTLISGRCKPVIFDFRDARFGSGVKIMYLWREDYVERSLKRKGVNEKKGYERYELPKSLTQADSNLGKYAHEFYKIIEREVKDEDELEYWLFKYFDIESHCHAIWMSPETNIQNKLLGLFNGLIDKSKQIDEIETENIVKSLKRLISWIERWYLSN